MAIERVTFETETSNRQGGKSYVAVLATGGDVEDFAGDERIAADIAPGIEAVRVRVPWTKKLKEALDAASTATFSLRGSRYRIRAKDRDGANVHVKVVGERLA